MARKILHAGGLFPPSHDRPIPTRCGLMLPFIRFAVWTVTGPVTCRRCKAALRKRFGKKR